MRSAGQTFLPQEPKETPVAYQNRVKRSNLTNYYRKAADQFSGKITRKQPEILEATSDSIKDLETNIDRKGNSIAQVTEMALSSAVDDGVVFMFVDSPADPTKQVDEDGNALQETPRTKGQDLREDLRPYVRIITADQLLGWKHHIDNGKEVLDQIRIFEMVTEPDPDDPWNELHVEQVRVVEPFKHELYRKMEDDSGKEDWMLYQTIITEFEEIPLVPLYTNKIAYLVAEPLFIDLANLNIGHWQSTSDQNNIVHVIRVPILFAVNLADADSTQELTIGPNSVVHGEPGASLEYVEHTGKAAEVGFLAIEKLEDHITRMGAEIIMNRKSGNPTATQRTLDQAEADSEMAAVSTSVEDAWQEVFRHMLIAFGEEVPEDITTIGVNMNKDFNLGMWDVSAIKDLLAMRTSGDLSQKTLWFEMKRIGILSEDFDEDQELEFLEVEEGERMDREAEMLRTAGQINEDPFNEGAGAGDDADDDGDQ